MSANQHIDHHGIMLHVYGTSIKVEGAAGTVYFRHSVDDNDIEAVKEIIDSAMEFMARRIKIKQDELARMLEGKL